MGLFGGAKTDNSAAEALKAEREREEKLRLEQEEKDREDQVAYAAGLRTSRSLLSGLPTGYDIG